jgi:CBS domain containing-hemolysin-like protein
VSLWYEIAAILFALIASAVYSGSETASYCVSRARIDVESRQGHRASRIVQHLLADETAFLIAVLIGNNLMVETMTWSTENLLRARGLPPWAVQAVLIGVLTPVVFFFAEMLPKDLYRRRPHALLSRSATFIFISRYAFWPLERLLYFLTIGLTRLLGFEPRLLSVVRGREAVLRLLSEGAQEGAILPHAEQMARNVLKLRSIPVERCMLPWANVLRIRRGTPDSELYATVAGAGFTRIPVEDEASVVIGYVHQLDVLGEGEGTAVLEQLRPAMFLVPGTPVDRALARLRSGGQRLAVVGTSERPEGLVTLKDVLEEISGDLAGW